MEAIPILPKMEAARSSTPSSLASPASNQRTSPSQLTPRSKVKAMMAAIEDESDSDAPAFSRSDNVRPINRPVFAKDRTMGTEFHGNSDNVGEEPFRKAPAPRGKLAARLQGTNVPTDEEYQSDSNDEDNAYARLKKKLANPSPRTSLKGNYRNPTHGSLDSDEDETVTVARKRRKRTPQLASAGPESRPALMKSPLPQSPGLFITPEKERVSRSPTTRPISGRNMDQRNGSGSDSSPAPQAKSHLFALVAGKRQQQLAKEAEATRKARAGELALKQSMRQKNGRGHHQTSDDESDGSDVEKLTQHLRPPRKASKKAEEENKRQIQRMSRNMQLAHQARTRKKITKESLFARFNFRIGPPPAPAFTPTHSSSAAASLNSASDAEVMHSAESPPTSPLTPGGDIPKYGQLHPETTNPRDNNPLKQSTVIEEELPDIEDVVTMSQERLDEANVRVVHIPGLNKDVHVNTTATGSETTIPKKLLRVQLRKHVGKPDRAENSESDLEILPTKAMTRKVDHVFARFPTSSSNEGHSLKTLRALAHLTSPKKQTRGKKLIMSLPEMQNSLQRRARQQAARERAEKIQELKDKGVIIQTAEERQKDQAEVEDLLENARLEAIDLKRTEKDKAKKEARANGETIADDTSEDDADYQENDADDSDLELSGSEEEGKNEVDDGSSNAEKSDGGHEDEEGDVSPHTGELVLDEVSEVSDDNDEEEEQIEESEASDLEDEELIRLPARCRHKRVINDDDDADAQEDQSRNVPPTQIANLYPSNLGLPSFAGAPMGMTQAFAATMADSQTPDNGRPEAAVQEEDSLAFLGTPPEPEFPNFDMQGSPQMIIDSQGMNATNSASQANISLHLSQYQVPMDSLQNPSTKPSGTQLSDIPDPTQDIGFALSSPVAGRFVSIPPSTVDTVILPRADEPESPILKKKGRLQRKTDIIRENESDVATNAGQEYGEIVLSANAFDMLRKGSKKSSDAVLKFDKKKSNAQEMVEEQAQESEDEYAGLGGASDDDSHGEEDEEVREMIEQGDVDVDERQLAAFYADKERASDEKAVEKLFKDINNGMLRRKRGADFDLSDSDDDVEARRRRKRREFAKLRKALLENENVGKIAQDPKKVAFLRAIEDREGDEDLDFLEQPEESSQPAMELDSYEIPDSQAQRQAKNTTVSAPSRRKRPLRESYPDAINRPAPAARRTTAMKKPLSLAEIRASVSFLIEEPDAVPIAHPSSSPVASDNETNENADINPHTSMLPPFNSKTADNNDNKTNPFASRRRPNPVIDRLSLKRESSSTASASASNTSHLAFHNPSTSGNPAFKVPSLLRRATTSSLNTNNSQDSHGISTLAETERGAGGTEKGDF
ncbi:MAG: hypothetical protein Q9172_007757, partial [Xanthocarpia lactea]